MTLNISSLREQLLLLYQTNPQEAKKKINHLPFSQLSMIFQSLEKREVLEPTAVNIQAAKKINGLIRERFKQIENTPLDADFKEKPQERSISFLLKDGSYLNINKTHLSFLESEMIDLIFANHSEPMLIVHNLLNECPISVAHLLKKMLEYSSPIKFIPYLSATNEDLIELHAILFKYFPGPVLNALEIKLLKNLTNLNIAALITLLVKFEDKANFPFLQQALIYAAKEPANQSLKDVEIQKNFFENIQKSFTKSPIRVDALTLGVLACCHMYGIGTLIDEDTALQIDLKSQELFKKSGCAFLCMLFNNNPSQDVIDAAVEERYPRALFLAAVNLKKTLKNTPSRENRLDIHHKIISLFEESISFNYLPAMVYYEPVLHSAQMCATYVSTRNFGWELNVGDNFLEKAANNGSINAALLLSRRAFPSEQQKWLDMAFSYLLSRAIDNKNLDALSDLEQRVQSKQLGVFSTAFKKTYLKYPPNEKLKKAKAIVDAFSRQGSSWAEKVLKEIADRW